MIKLSIVILSYNTNDLTLACLKSAADQYKKELEKKDFEIIVVDNASSDGSVDAISCLQKEVPNLRLIQNRENLGFAKGCNIGAKAAEGEYLLFLNSDTKVLDRGFLSMADFLEKNKNVAILGGKLVNNDGSIQRSCGKFYNLFNLVLVLLGMERIGFVRSSPSKIQQVDWVSGACMMIEKKLFNNLEGFDEYFFMYIEDMELCFRVGKVGLLTYFYPDIKLFHESLGSSNRTFAIINIYKGILYFYAKHKSHLGYLIAKALLITKAEILMLVGFLTLNSDLTNRYKKAINFDL